MTIRFACPSCGVAGSADAAFMGKPARCKQCARELAVPAEGEAVAGYALEDPVENAAAFATGSSFVRTRGDDPPADVSRKPKRVSRVARAKRQREAPDIAWGKWLIRSAAAIALMCAGIAIVAPRGTVIVGGILLALGSIMVLAGFAAGAYGAFSEDFAYGVLYMAVPLYAGYYLLTRWDDLWPWFTCATVGFLLVLFGTELLRWNGLT